MIRLDAATVLLQWAVGGLLFLWVTTRRREVGLGYGWLLRGTYVLMAARRCVAGLRYGEAVPVRDVSQRRGRARPRGVALAVSVAAAQGRRVGRARGGSRAAQRPGGRHDRHRASSRVARDEAGREFPPRARSDRAGRRARRPGRRRVSLPAIRRCCRCRARSWAPRSSAPSPTPCCSATGTSCSRAWPRGPLLELVRLAGRHLAVRGGGAAVADRAWSA